MFRIAIIAVVIGGILTFSGIQELRVSSNTTAEPIAVDLAQIEAGEIPENSHWLVGEHVALFAGCVYEYSQSKNEQGEPSASTRCTYCYYPILSYDHPYIAKLMALKEQYGSLNIVPDAEFPTLSDFRVLVKSKQFSTVGAIPDGMDGVDSVQGLVVNQITSLDSEEEELFHQGFPQLNTDELLLLEAGREPASFAKTGGLVGGGMLLLIGGVAAIFYMMKSDGAEQPQEITS